MRSASKCYSRVTDRARHDADSMAIAIATPELFRKDDLWRLPDGTSTIVRGVPFFDEHDEFDQRKTIKNDKGEEVPNPNYGQLTRRFDAARLQHICDKNNQRFRKTGDPAARTLGHTRPGRPESEQPPIFGYAINFRLGRFGPEQTLGILGDDYVLPKMWDQYLEHPRRSVEFFADDDIFDPIASLKRTPERDLGIIQQYMRSGRDCVRYALSACQLGRPRLCYSMSQEGEIMPEATNQPFNPHEGAAKKDAATQPGGGDVAGMKKPWDWDDDDQQYLENGKLPEQHAKTAVMYMKHCAQTYRKMQGFFGDEDLKKGPEMHDASGGAGAAVPGGAGAAAAPSPSSTNTQIPSMGMSEEEKKRMMMGGQQHAREESSIHYARRLEAAERELAVLKSERDQARSQASSVHAENCVTTLEGEGYYFGDDRTAEVQRYEKIGEAERYERMLHHRRYAQKNGAPTGGFGLFRSAETADPTGVAAMNGRLNGPAEMFSKEQTDQAVRIALKDPEYSKDPNAAYQKALAAIKKTRSA